MRGFVNVIARFEEPITIVRKNQTVHSGLGSPTISAQEEWNLSGVILPERRDTDTRSQGISVKTGKAKLYLRLDIIAKKSGSVLKKTLEQLGLQANDEIIANSGTYLINRVARYERGFRFLVADISQKPVVGGV